MKISPQYIYCALFFSITFLNTQSQVKYHEGLFAERITAYIVSQDSMKIFLNINNRSWFTNDYIIEELGVSPSFIHDVFIENRFKDVRYVFKNFKDSTVYEYGSMTDTATCLGVYKMYNDIKLTNGSIVSNGMLGLTPVSGPVKLADTTIDNVMYNRFAIETDTVGLHVMNVHYLQCEYPDILSLAPRHNKILGSPTIMHSASTFEFRGKDAGEFGIWKRSLVRDSLTVQEIKVFDAWKQYATKNPFKEKQVVKKNDKKRKGRRKK